MRLRSILRYLFIWQIAIILVSLVSIKVLPWRETFLGGGSRIFSTFPALYSRANFDGNNYISISINGYGYSSQAFFPLYPTLIRYLRGWAHPTHDWQFQTSAIVGTVISMVCFWAGAVFLVKLVELDYSPAISKLTLIILLLFPTSFFFGAVYTEGMFFLLVMASFYFARTKSWWLSAVLAGLASYTRFIGIFLLPALGIEFWMQTEGENVRRRMLRMLPIVIAPLGLLAYMHFLLRTTGDPLAFIHSLPSFGEFRSERVILLYQVFWRYAKMIATVDRSGFGYWTIALEAAVGLVFLATSIWSFAKQRLSYAVFNITAYLVPTLTGSFVSLPRYVLMCFPSFILLAQLLSKRPKLLWGYLVVSGVTLVVFLGLFTVGYWVA